MAISILKTRERASTKYRGPARRALFNATAMLPHLNETVIQLAKREAEEVAHVEAHRAAKLAFNPDDINVDIGDVIASLPALAKRAKMATEALTEIRQKMASAERDRALVGAQMRELRRAAVHEAIGELADRAYAANAEARELLEELTALCQLHDLAVQEVRAAGGAADFVGWPRLRDYADMWVPEHPSFTRAVPSLEDVEVSRALDARKARLERELFQQ